MVKVFALIPRRQDVTEEFFHEHWAGPHADLAKRITTMRTYVQSHRAGPGVPGLDAAPYEGIAEVWFDDAATAAGMGEDPNYVNGCHVDEPIFIDMDNLGFMLTTEQVLRAGPAVAQEAGGVKAMLLLRRAAGLAPADFAARLHAAGAGLADAASGARRVTLSTALPDSYADGAEPAFDAVAELFFADADADRASGDAAAALLDALGEAVDRERSRGFTAQELRVIWPQQLSATA